MLGNKLITTHYATHLQVITVDLAVPVFRLFSSRNPDFIMYMAELRVDEFGMTFQLRCSKHLRYEFHTQYISTFYAKSVWWNNIP
jgi:hypothetical protein